MTVVERETEVRMALRHVRTGLRCIVRQRGVIATLHAKGLPTEQAQAVLHWLEEMQRGFEEDFEKILSENFARIDQGYAALGVSPPR